MTTLERQNNDGKLQTGTVPKLDTCPVSSYTDSSAACEKTNNAPSVLQQKADSLQFCIKQVRTISAFVPGGRKAYGFKVKRLILNYTNECIYNPTQQDTGAVMVTLTVSPEWNSAPASLYDRITKGEIFKRLFRQKLHIHDYLFAIQFTENGYFHYHGILPWKSLPSGFYNPTTTDFRFKRPAHADGYQPRQHFFDLKRCKEFLVKHRIGEVCWLSPRTTSEDGYTKIVGYILADLFEDAPLPAWVLKRSGMKFFTKSGLFRSLGIQTSNSQGRPKARRPERGHYQSRSPNRTYAEVGADNDIKVNIFFTDPVTGKVKFENSIYGYLPAIKQHLPGIIFLIRRNPRTGEEYPSYGFDSEDTYLKCLEYHEDPEKIREFKLLRVKKLRAYQKQASGDRLAIGAPGIKLDGTPDGYTYHPHFDEDRIYSDLTHIRP